MSALGQKQTLEYVRDMSALPPKADIGTQPCDVRFVPKADSCTAAIELCSITSSASNCIVLMSRRAAGCYAKFPK